MAGRIAYYGGIVKDGLVLDLDAAKLDSYPKAGTVWNDVSDFRNNGILTNGSTFNSENGGSIVFDGVDDYVDCGNGSSLNITGDLSVSIWIKTTGVSGNHVIFAKHSLPSNIANYEGYLKGTAIYWWDGAAERSTGLTVSSNIWNNITYVRSSSLVTAYINYSVSGSVGVISQGPVSGNLTIGKDQNSQNFQGNIATVHIYNKALSSSEVLQNFNAIKGRYGL